MQAKPKAPAVPARTKVNATTPLPPPMASGPAQPLSRRVFTKYDADNSGHISKEEFAELCYEMGHHLSPEELDLAYRRIDTSGDGRIEYSEFYQWWRSDSRWVGLEMDDIQLDKMLRISAIFRQYDQDRSGVLDKVEFRKCYDDLIRRGLQLKPFDECFASIDTDGNGNGEISLNEFIEWYQRGQTPPPRRPPPPIPTKKCA